jgi:hypothetical protein
VALFSGFPNEAILRAGSASTLPSRSPRAKSSGTCNPSA